MFHGHLVYFQKPTLGGRPNAKPGDHGTLKTHNRWFILFYHVWGPVAWIDIHWNSIWLRARSHTTSHYTWESVTSLHDLGGVLGRPLDTLFWAVTILWSRLLACVWSSLQQGINLKGCLYFIGKGNLEFSLSKWRVTLKIALHVCIEVFVESAHYHVYYLSDVENYNISETEEHTWWISMAWSIIRDRLLLFSAVHFEGFTEHYPFLFEGLQNILKGMWRVGPQNKGNSPSILFLGLHNPYQS